MIFWLLLFVHIGMNSPVVAVCYEYGSFGTISTCMSYVYRVVLYIVSNVSNVLIYRYFSNFRHNEKSSVFFSPSPLASPFLLC